MKFRDRPGVTAYTDDVEPEYKVKWTHETGDLDADPGRRPASVHRGAAYMQEGLYPTGGTSSAMPRVDVETNELVFGEEERPMSKIHEMRENQRAKMSEYHDASGDVRFDDDVVGIGIYTTFTDAGTVAKVQQAIVALPPDKQDPEFQPMKNALATQKNAYGIFGPTTKRAVKQFNKLYGWPTHGDNITDGTLLKLNLLNLIRPDLMPAPTSEYAMAQKSGVPLDPYASSPAGGASYAAPVASYPASYPAGGMPFDPYASYASGAPIYPTVSGAAQEVLDTIKKVTLPNVTPPVVAPAPKKGFFERLRDLHKGGMDILGGAGTEKPKKDKPKKATPTAYAKTASGKVVPVHKGTTVAKGKVPANAVASATAAAGRAERAGKSAIAASKKAPKIVKLTKIAGDIQAAVDNFVLGLWSQFTEEDASISYVLGAAGKLGGTKKVSPAMKALATKAAKSSAMLASAKAKAKEAPAKVAKANAAIEKHATKVSDHAAKASSAQARGEAAAAMAVTAAKGIQEQIKKLNKAGFKIPSTKVRGVDAPASSVAYNNMPDGAIPYDPVVSAKGWPEGCRASSKFYETNGMFGMAWTAGGQGQPQWILMMGRRGMYKDKDFIIKNAGLSFATAGLATPFLAAAAAIDASHDQDPVYQAFGTDDRGAAKVSGTNGFGPLIGNPTMPDFKGLNYSPGDNKWWWKDHDSAPVWATQEQDEALAALAKHEQEANDAADAAAQAEADAIKAQADADAEALKAKNDLEDAAIARAAEVQAAQLAVEDEKIQSDMARQQAIDDAAQAKIDQEQANVQAASDQKLMEQQAAQELKDQEAQSARDIRQAEIDQKRQERQDEIDMRAADAAQRRQEAQDALEAKAAQADIDYAIAHPEQAQAPQQAAPSEEGGEEGAPTPTRNRDADRAALSDESEEAPAPTMDDVFGDWNTADDSESNWQQGEGGPETWKRGEGPGNEGTVDGVWSHRENALSRHRRNRDER